MNFFRISLFLFFVSTLVSQSFMDLFASFLVVGWIGYFSKNAKKKGEPFFHKMGLEKLWIPWLVVVILGFVLNPLSLAYALGRVFEFKWIFQVYIFIEIFRLSRPEREIFKIFLGTILLAALINLGIYYLDWDFLSSLRYGDLGGGDHRAGGLFKNPMTFAHLFALYVSILLGIFLTNLKIWSNALRGITFVTLSLALFCLVLTFTRGVWIGFSIAALVGVFIFNFRWGILAAILVGMTAFFGLRNIPGIQDKIHQTQMEFDGKSERKNIWRTNIEIFKSSPLVGVGYGQNIQMLPEYFAKLGFPADTLQSHAHNQYLHLLTGTGILGLICYLVLWAFFILLSWRLFQHCRGRVGLEWDQGVALGSFIAMISFSIGSLTESNFEHSKVRYCLMLIWAYLIFLSSKHGVTVWKKSAK